MQTSKTVLIIAIAIIAFIVIAIIIGVLVFTQSSTKDSEENSSEGTIYEEEQEPVLNNGKDDTEFLKEQYNKDNGDNEIKNWKTYQNIKYNFQFQYPSDWTLGDSPSSNIPDNYAQAISFDSPHTYARFHVEVYNTNTEMGNMKNCNDVNTCVSNNRVNYSDGQETTGLSDFTLNSINGKKETITRGNWKYYVYYFYQDKNLFTISLETSMSDDEKAFPELEKILATFQFNKKE